MRNFLKTAILSFICIFALSDPPLFAMESSLLEDVQQVVGPKNPITRVNIYEVMNKPLEIAMRRPEEPKTAAFVFKMVYSSEDAKAFEKLSPKEQLREFSMASSHINQQRTLIFQNAQNLLNRCGLGKVFADMQCVEGFPIWIREGESIQESRFSGVIQRFQACLPFYGKYSVESESLVHSFERLSNRYGGLSALELKNGFKYDIYSEEFARILAHISFRSVEEDLVAFLLTRSGDANLRNYVLWLNQDGRIEYKDIDNEDLGTDFAKSCPLAMRLKHSDYPFSNEMVDRILGWNLEIFVGQEQATNDIVRVLQTCLRTNPGESMYNLYFKVFKALENTVGRYGGYSFLITGSNMDLCYAPWIPIDCEGRKPVPRDPKLPRTFKILP